MLVVGATFVPACLLEMTTSAGTQVANAEIIILKGLKGVSVEVVQPVSRFEDSPRFNPVKVDDLRAKVERRLNKAGIEVFKNTWNDPESGHIVVIVNTRKAGSSFSFVVQVKTKLYQLAELVRDAGLQIMVPTWPIGENALEAETTVVINRSEIARTVEDEVERQIELLVSDYLDANSPPEPKPDISNMMTGTIKYVKLEGGCYNIFADNGIEYHPVNLPSKYKRHGLRVAFQAIRSESVGIPYSGIRVEIIRITKL
jgi:hypothetical protein